MTTQKNLKRFRNFRHRKRWSKAAKKLDYEARQRYNRSDGYLGYRGIDRIAKVERTLIDDVFCSLDLMQLQSYKIKEARLAAIRGLLTEYGRYDILFVEEREAVPEKAFRVNDTEYLFLIKERVSMPLEQFLLFLIGDDFIPRDQLNPVLGEWAGIPEMKIDYVYRNIIIFFREMIVRRNATKRKESEVCLPNIPEDSKVLNIIGTVNNFYIPITS